MSSSGVVGKTGTGQITRLSDVAPKPVEWIWKGFIPAGNLTLLSAEPGVGKSSITLDLAARLTTGRPMPDGTAGKLGGVLILNAEDSLTHTIIPRLKMMGADLNRVYTLDDVMLDRDMGRIAQAVRQQDVSLVVVDPVNAFVGGVNPNLGAEVRSITRPIKEIAEQFGTAFILVNHFNKDKNASTTNKAAGSIDWIGAARSGLHVGGVPSFDCNALYVAKSNLGATRRAMLYRIDTAGRVVWEEPPPGFDVDAALSGRLDPRVFEAVQFLEHLRLEHGQEIRSTIVREQYNEAGIRQTHIDQAKTFLGVTSQKRGGTQGYWVWVFPERRPSAATAA